MTDLPTNDGRRQVRALVRQPPVRIRFPETAQDHFQHLALAVPTDGTVDAPTGIVAGIDREQNAHHAGVAARSAWWRHGVVFAGSRFFR
ncbi:MAG TPA: hypothetical protein PK440_06285 [Candidatus Accumulibacter phosphatis]|nr:MAG: hypothetical protein AW07_02448 [Candidatus Accumulibacter sp. SK-11]HRL75638.1 hypothetical protein [Candidatus Accumulibacter phosphatis]HRQ94598.1 hypothetical protein [Candidatus Accumulibacter phosphatis]